MLNQDVLTRVQGSGAKLVAVTKYFNGEKTREILAEIEGQGGFWVLGENRIDDLKSKNLPREKVHFIGNIQSRRIQEIVEYSSGVHSLCSIAHVEKLSQAVRDQGRGPLCVFVQVNISGEGQKQGVREADLASLVAAVESFPELEFIGISAMGRGTFTYQEKVQEFEQLKNLRDQYLPGKILSAGTSCDYQIALKQGIEVIRIGQALFDAC